MLTVDAIVSKRFDKAMGGYRQDDVDAFLQQIAIEYERLQNENQDLEDKLEILAEKIEQYRKDETGLKTALIGAQKLGEGLLRDAKNQVEQMRREALRDLEATKLQLERDIQREKYELSHLQKETANFKNKLMGMYVSQMDLIRNIPVPEEFQSPPPEQEEKPEPAPAPAAAPDLQAEEEPPQQGETPQEPEQSAPQAVRPPITLFQEREEEGDFDVEEEEGYAQAEEVDSRFGPLKFGAGYEVTSEKSGGEFRKKFSFKRSRETL